MFRQLALASCIGLCLAGCSGNDQPQLDDEQLKAAKFLREQFDPRIYAINERLQAIEFKDEDSQFKWLMALVKMATRYQAMRAEQGHEAAIAWYDSESRKSGDELLTTWGK